MNFLRNFILLFCCYVFAAKETDIDANSLRLVHVFFRHGARTPEFKDAYPTDPYAAKTFQPMGWGQLTNKGKTMAYTLGQILRQRYDRFLGDLYTPEIVKVQSTDFDRTKMSALLVLASLFPPGSKQKWSKHLNWLPIPVDYEKFESDYYLTRPNAYCPKFRKELKNIFELEDTLAYLKSQKKTFDYISNHTGKLINTLSDVFDIYQTLLAESTMNLTLPEWTHDMYPEKITKLAVKQCELENYNDLLKRLSGGRMLSKIRSDIISKTEGLLQPHERRIFLYSGHDYTVINTLAVLNLYKPHFPKYSSAILIELHYLRSRQEYAVKLLYIHDVYEPAEELILDGCEMYCPLKDFLHLTGKRIPKNYTAECGSPINLG